MVLPRGCCPSRQGSSAILNHRAQVPGEVRSDYTRSIPLNRALGRARRAARPRRAGGRQADGGRVDGRRQARDRDCRLLRSGRPPAGHRGALRRPRPAADDVVLPQEGYVGERQRSADPGAAEHGRRLVQPRHWRVAGRPRLHEQHLPHQRPAGGRTTPGFAVRTGAFDAECASGGVDRPVGRARGPQGRPGRVGGRPQRHDQRPDDRLPLVPLRPRRGDELHRQGWRRPLRRRRRSSAAFGLQFDHPAAMPGRRPSRPPRRPRQPAGPARCRRPSARRRRCACACSTSASTSTG